MTATGALLIPSVDGYSDDRCQVSAASSGTGARSRNEAFLNTRSAVRTGLMPKRFCMPQRTEQAAGHPNSTPFSAKQWLSRWTREEHVPEHLEAEVQCEGGDDEALTDLKRSRRYWHPCRVRLATSLHDFVLAGTVGSDALAEFEDLHLAKNALSSWNWTEKTSDLPLKSTKFFGDRTSNGRPLPSRGTWLDYPAAHQHR